MSERRLTTPGQALHMIYISEFRHRWGGNVPNWRQLSDQERQLWEKTAERASTERQLNPLFGLRVKIRLMIRGPMSDPIDDPIDAAVCVTPDGAISITLNTAEEWVLTFDDPAAAALLAHTLAWASVP